MSLTADAIETIAYQARQASSAEQVNYSTPYLVHDHDGAARIIVTPDNHNAKPAYKEVQLSVTDVASFTNYLDKHGVEGETEIMVTEAITNIRAIIDAGNQGHPGRAAHNIHLNPPVDPDWKAWTQIDGELLSQEQFADFIEDQALNIKEPDAATMLEIAQSMQVNQSVEFEQGHRNQDGQVRFAWRETSGAKAGANGDLEIPATIKLGLSPFKGGATYKVEARLRWRIRNKQLSIGVKLNRPDLVRDGAFAELVEQVEVWNTAGPQHLITRH